jgi:hypothetical protein
MPDLPNLTQEVTTLWIEVLETEFFGSNERFEAENH